MATSEPLCDVCQLQNISKPAVSWCAECDEALCGACDDLHSRRKLTKNHKTISITDYQRLPQSALEIKHHCSTHEEKYEFYCTNHVTPCCVKCVKEDHKKCEIDSLRDVVQNIKTSSSVTNIEQNLSEIRSIFQNIMDEKSNNLKHIDEKTTTYQKEIADLRKQINCHLDALELEMNKNLRDKQQEVNTTVEGFLSIIESKVINVEKVINNINQMKSHATDLQLFLALREIENNVKRELSYIKELKTKPEMRTFDVELKVSDGLKSLQKDVKVWGEISIKTFESTVQTPRQFQFRSAYGPEYYSTLMDGVKEKSSGTETITVRSLSTVCKDVAIEKQAQIILPCKMSENVTDIHSIALKKKNSFKVESANSKVTGCEILPDGNIVLVNQTDKTILMYNQVGSRINEFKMKWKPYDIAYMCNGIIAISFIDEKKICKFSTTNEQLDTVYKSSEGVSGIAYKDGKLFLRYKTVGIRIITESGTLISEIKFDSISTTHLCVGNAGDLYYCIREKPAVICCDIKGNIKWTSKNYLLNEVFGITCGLGDIVFVADYVGGITVISSDGQQIKRILNKSFRLDRPYCINFKMNQLLVCNHKGGQVFLYDVQ